MFLPIRDHNPSRRRPYLTYAIIALNIVVYFSYRENFHDGTIALVYRNWALLPVELVYGGSWHGLLTSLFLHGGLWHLATNMLTLYIFGDNVEDRFGHAGFLLFYLACGVAAGIIYTATNPLSDVPVVGASGAIAGVMSGYLLLFPKARVDIVLILIVFFKILTVRAWVYLGFWIAVEFLLLDNATGGVARWAHVGGFIAGLIFTFPIWLFLGGPRFWVRTDGHPENPPSRPNQAGVPKHVRTGGPSGKRPDKRGAQAPGVTRKRTGSPWTRN